MRRRRQEQREPVLTAPPTSPAPALVFARGTVTAAQLRWSGWIRRAPPVPRLLQVLRKHPNPPSPRRGCAGFRTGIETRTPSEPTPGLPPSAPPLGTSDGPSAECTFQSLTIMQNRRCKRQAVPRPGRVRLPPSVMPRDTPAMLSSNGWPGCAQEWSAAHFSLH